MKILIADDHVLFRQGLMQILAEEFPRTVFGEASNTRELMDCVQKQTWDVVLLDITMPGRNGLDVLKEIDPPSGARAGSDLRLRLSQRRPQTSTETAETNSGKSQNSDDDLATGHRGSLATKTTG